MTDTAIAVPVVKTPKEKPKLVAGERIRPIIPTSIEEAFRLATAIIRAGLAPRSYEYDRDAKDQDGRALLGPDPEKVMIGILKSLEVGLPPITGLSTIAIINKRPCLWGDGAVALIQQAGVLESMEVIEIGAKPKENADLGKFADDYGIEVRMKRVGQETPYIGRFTVGDAKRAKLWANAKKEPWMLYPRRQMKWRAFGWAARDGFSDCLAGLHIREEIEDMTQEQARAKTDVSFLEDDLPTKVIEYKPEVDLTVWRIDDQMDFTPEFCRRLKDAVASGQDVADLVTQNDDRLTPELRKLAEDRARAFAEGQAA